jgi:hypothetical protein
MFKKFETKNGDTWINISKITSLHPCESTVYSNEYTIIYLEGGECHVVKGNADTIAVDLGIEYVR